VVTFEVKVEVTDKDKSLLRPQMTGTVTIIEDERKNVLMIPSATVIHRANQTSVQLAGGQTRTVQLGLDGGEDVEVVSGLHEGDTIVSQASEQPTRWKSGGGGPGGPPP
jgi:HlyD family secretion protein